jgi:hypothetical protein
VVRVIAVLVLVGGCRQILGIDDLTANLDAPVDSVVESDAPDDARTCGWDALNIDSCAVPPGTDVVVVTGAMVYVDGALDGTPLPSMTVMQIDGSMIQVASLASLEIAAGGSITVMFPTMVVFAVAGDVRIAGTIDVAARVLRDTETIGCSAQDGTGPDSGHGGGGNGTAGGDGGRDGATGLSGGNGGAALPGPLVPLHAGCPGHVETAAYGDGGGALEITAGGAIVVESTATISATGQNGGRGIATEGMRGGHGGGSGGSILLDGETISFAGIACATGGGGGGGAGASADGEIGEFGACDGKPALGGVAGGNGGGGGSGGGAPDAPGDGDDGFITTNSGGGGGGGAAGKIRLRGRSALDIALDAKIYPAPMMF